VGLPGWMWTHCGGGPRQRCAPCRGRASLRPAAPQPRRAGGGMPAQAGHSCVKAARSKPTLRLSA